MATSLGFSLKASQSLALTPQLQQSIRLLQLSALELELEIQQMVEQNPCLTQDEDDADTDTDDGPPIDLPRDFVEDDERGAAGSEEGTNSDAEAVDRSTESADSEPSDWEGDGSVSSDELEATWAELPGKQREGVEDERSSEPHLADGSLVSHLVSQTHHLRLDPLERAALHLLIHSLNDDGFLEEPIETLYAALGNDDPSVLPDFVLQAGDEWVMEPAGMSALRMALNILHQLDPIGVGASGPIESLHIQAQAKAQAARADGDAAEVALWGSVDALLSAPLSWVALRDVSKLSKQTGMAPAQVQSAITALQSLSPKPAQGFGEPAASVVVPEVLVRRVGSSLKVELNPKVRHNLRLDTGLARQLRGVERDSAMGQKLQEAKWFVKNLQQRYDTILRVSQVIVARQRRFFLHGATEMRPLVLREVADELGVHESTVSRVTTAKYLQGPTGTFELKYFFAAALETVSGGSTSATAVKALLKSLVADENPHEPLSDAQLVEALSKKGVVCARRTVAKYREALQIPVAQFRKSVSL